MQPPLGEILNIAEMFNYFFNVFYPDFMCSVLAHLGELLKLLKCMLYYSLVDLFCVILLSYLKQLLKYGQISQNIRFHL